MWAGGLRTQAWCRHCSGRSSFVILNQSQLISQDEAFFPTTHGKRAAPELKAPLPPLCTCHTLRSPLVFDVVQLSRHHHTLCSPVHIGFFCVNTLHPHYHCSLDTRWLGSEGGGLTHWGDSSDMEPWECLSHWAAVRPFNLKDPFMRNKSGDWTILEGSNIPCLVFFVGLPPEGFFLCYT